MNRFNLICKFLRGKNMLSIETINHYLDNPHLMDDIELMLYPTIQKKIKDFIKLNMKLNKHIDVMSIVNCIDFRPDIVVENLTYLINTGQVKKEIIGFNSSYKLINHSL
jgi:hypothetical protein